MGIRDYPAMYGVDECRRCGAKIQPKGAGERDAYLAMMRSRRVMPEAQWRKMGFLAPPTKRQLGQPSAGCCHACGILLMNQKMKPWRRMAIVAGIGLVAFAAIKLVGMYLLY